VGALPLILKCNEECLEARVGRGAFPARKSIMDGLEAEHYVRVSGHSVRSREFLRCDVARSLGTAGPQFADETTRAIHKRVI